METQLINTYDLKGRDRKGLQLTSKQYSGVCLSGVAKATRIAVEAGRLGTWGVISEFTEDKTEA
jgi:hypothetical protein